MKRPIRVFFSPLTGRFFATQHYDESSGEIDLRGPKTDVTDDIARAIKAYNVEFFISEDDEVIVEEGRP